MVFLPACGAVALSGFRGSAGSREAGRDLSQGIRRAGGAISVLERGPAKPQTLVRSLACVENSMPMRSDSVMKLGSVTKVLTGLRIRMLIEEGKLSEDAPLSRFFLDQVRGEEITIRHLLSIPRVCPRCSA